MDYQGFRFQSHLNKKGYLETLLDISSSELNEPNFQPEARSMYIDTSLLDISSLGNQRVSSRLVQEKLRFFMH